MIPEFTRQVFAGKTIGRILFNTQVAIHCANLFGKVLDLASGGQASYTRFLPKNIEITRTDSSMKNGVVSCIDFNNILPFNDSEFDAVLFFNALYIAENRVSTLKEVHRVLKNGGTLYLSTPLLYGEIPEPVDYCRLTYQGLGKELKEVGFSNVRIIRFGERFTAATNLLHPFFALNSIRFVIYGLSLFLDKMIPVKIRKNNPAPLGYFCISTK